VVGSPGLASQHDRKTIKIGNDTRSTGSSKANKPAW